MHADHRCEHRARSDARRASGFTLLEILVALSIMAGVMVIVYSINQVTLDTRERIEREVRAASLGPEILDIVAADLRRVWLRELDGDPVLRGEDGSLLGEEADRLSLVTTVDSTVTRRVGVRTVASDVCETGYRLRVNPAVPDVLELWRRQSFHVDEEPLKDGTYERLHDRVVAFDLKYYPDDDERTEPEESWDSSTEHALPAMVSIRLGLEVGPRVVDDRGRTARGTRTVWYERLVPLPRDAALAMRAHALRPTFTAQAASGAGGSGGSGGSGGNGEGEGEGAGGGGGSGGGGGGKGGGGGGGPPPGGGPLGGGAGAGGGAGGGGAGGGSGGSGPPGGDSIDLDKILEELFGGGGG